MHYPACAAALERKKKRFCVLETPKRGVFNGKLDCKSGAAEFFFGGRREQKTVFPWGVATVTTPHGKELAACQKPTACCVGAYHHLAQSRPIARAVCASRSSLWQGRSLVSPAPRPEREFPALLVVWAYQQKQLFFGRGHFFFARKRDKRKWGIFSVFSWCFSFLFGGVFVLFGCVLFFVRQRDFLGGVFFRRHTTPKRGIPALTMP